jgi:DNA-binding NarL/FixJ family response regulator
MTIMLPPSLPHGLDDANRGLTEMTPAERRVLGLLTQGMSNRAIASALVLSPRTVESHVSSMLEKSGCSQRCELLVWALTRS